MGLSGYTEIVHNTNCVSMEATVAQNHLHWFGHWFGKMPKPCLAN